MPPPLPNPPDKTQKTSLLGGRPYIHSTSPYPAGICFSNWPSGSSPLSSLFPEQLFIEHRYGWSDNLVNTSLLSLSTQWDILDHVGQFPVELVAVPHNCHMTYLWRFSARCKFFQIERKNISILFDQSCVFKSNATHYVLIHTMCPILANVYWPVVLCNNVQLNTLWCVITHGVWFYTICRCVLIYTQWIIIFTVCNLYSMCN